MWVPGREQHGLALVMLEPMHGKPAAVRTAWPGPGSLPEANARTRPSPPAERQLCVQWEAQASGRPAFLCEHEEAPTGDWPRRLHCFTRCSLVTSSPALLPGPPVLLSGCFSGC